MRQRARRRLAWVRPRGGTAVPAWVVAELVELDRAEARQARLDAWLGPADRPSPPEAPGAPETPETPRVAPERHPQGQPGTVTRPDPSRGPRPADMRPWPRRPGP